MASNNDVDAQVGVEDLPMTFKVKYIGNEVARGLWGIKYTRRPVDSMVAAAKKMPRHETMQLCNLKVSLDGVSIENLDVNSRKQNWSYPIDTISYGVQDLIFTRVFAMIIVNDEYSLFPFEVHAFLCDSRATARKLTYALAAAFQDYSRKMKDTMDEECCDNIACARQKFAIDLRTPEELAEDDETEA